jgi:hypothetical protein
LLPRVVVSANNSVICAWSSGSTSPGFNALAPAHAPSSVAASSYGIDKSHGRLAQSLIDLRTRVTGSSRWSAVVVFEVVAAAAWSPPPAAVVWCMRTVAAAAAAAYDSGGVIAASAPRCCC